MERTKYLILLFAFCSQLTYAQTNYKKEIYDAYISNNMNKWKNTINSMNLQANKSTDLLFELTNYQYGYIAWCIGNKMNSTAEAYLKLGEKNIEILTQAAANASLINTYQSAFYAFRIGLNSLKAPFFGPKSLACSKKAMELDKNNPMGIIQYAKALYYMPTSFGGSKSLAVVNYKKAEKLMEAKPEMLKHDWNYLNLLNDIAKAYEELKDNQNAKLYYEKILTIEPQFLWVKNESYPKLLKKIK